MTSLEVSAFTMGDARAEKGARRGRGEKGVVVEGTRTARRGPATLQERAGRLVGIGEGRPRVDGVENRRVRLGGGGRGDGGGGISLAPVNL